MRVRLPLALLLTFASFAATAEAHTCTANDCGDCQEGGHVHNYANGTLFCESIGDNDTPGPSVPLVLLAVVGLALASGLGPRAR